MTVAMNHPAKAGWRFVKPSVIPGFGLTFGYTLLYLSIIVLIPIIGLFLKAATISPEQIWKIASAARTLNALKISFGASLIAAIVNVIFGLIVAWVLVRYKFPFRRLLDAVVDLPFALPTAVSGIALTTLYAKNGWFGSVLAEFGIQGAFSPFGITIALAFVGFPFVVRTVQPVLEEFEAELEEAAATLGANRWQTFTRVILPVLTPALLTGFALAFARALGEYGSVIFIAGNMPMVSEITPLLIITKLEQYDYAGATAIAVVMLVVAFGLLLAINALQAWTRKRQGR